MKILYICTYYHRAMIFRDAMNELAKRGKEVRVFNAVAYNSKVDEKYIEIMDSLVVHSECFNKYDRFFYPFKQRKIYKSLLSSYDINQFDIIHSHMLFNGGMVAYLVKKKFGIPYVVSIRNTDINVFLKIPFFRRLANKIVEEAAGIQFLSTTYKDNFINNFVREELKRTTNDKSEVISNGLEKFWLDNKSLPRNREVTENTIRLLCVGKIDRNKNILTTINAIKLLITKGYSVKFTVVGQVIDEDVYNELKKESFVDVIQFLKKEELIRIYKENHIYVMPSISESFGRVYAEAMTQGLPVIYTKGQGFDGLFKEGHVGYAVPSNDYEFISNAIIKITENYENISLNCLNECERFNWNNIGDELNELYINSHKRGK